MNRKGPKMKTSKLAILSIVAILFLAGSNLFAHSHRCCPKPRPRPRMMKKHVRMHRVEISNRRAAQANSRRSYTSSTRAANDRSNYVNGYYVGGSNYNSYNNSYNGRNRVTTTVTTTTTVTKTTSNRSRY